MVLSPLHGNIIRRKRRRKESRSNGEVRTWILVEGLFGGWEYKKLIKGGVFSWGFIGV